MAWVVIFISYGNFPKVSGTFKDSQSALEWMKKDINNYIENLKKTCSKELLEKVNLTPVTPSDFSAYLEYYNENPQWYISEIQSI